MEKIDINSPDAKSQEIVAENVRQLGELFPELLTEGPTGSSINIDVLKQLVGDASVSEGDEKYGLSWFGKRNARKVALTPSLGTLLPSPSESFEWDLTKNLLIEGDNLEVLKILQKSYAGKIKLIYIDPPYNTGRDFVYPDNYHDNIKNYLEITGQTDEGRKISSNSESNGRFHTDWLNMMYPRLKLAQSLLAPNGLIFISIDQNEVDNLVKTTNEIFGENNALGVVAVVNNLKGRSDDEFFATANEFLVVLAKDRYCASLRGLGTDEDYRAEFKLSDEISNYKEVGLRKTGKNSRRIDRPNMFYPIYFALDSGSLSLEPNENSVEIYPIDTEGNEGCWRWGRETFLTNKDTELVCRQVNDRWNIYVKMRDVVDGEARTVRPKTVWIDPKYDTGAGVRAMRSLFEGVSVFDNPKPVELIRDIISMATSGGDIVLDFFAGSGTTGQAVMEQNNLDGGDRKFILVQLPELLIGENKEQAIALAFCKEHDIEENLAALTAERLRRSGAKIRSENSMLTSDVGFRVFKLAESNIRAWNPFAENLEDTLRSSEDHLVEGRSELEVLYEILLKRGLDLCITIETKELTGHLVHAVGGGVLFACLDNYIATNEVESLAEAIVMWREELGVVGEVSCIFRDSSFNDDMSKTNMSSILTQAGFTSIQSL